MAELAEMEEEHVRALREMRAELAGDELRADEFDSDEALRCLRAFAKGYVVDFTDDPAGGAYRRSCWTSSAT